MRSSGIGRALDAEACLQFSNQQTWLHQRCRHSSSAYLPSKRPPRLLQAVSTPKSGLSAVTANFTRQVAGDWFFTERGQQDWVRHFPALRNQIQMEATMSNLPGNLVGGSHGAQTDVTRDDKTGQRARHQV